MPLSLDWGAVQRNRQQGIEVSPTSACRFENASRNYGLGRLVTTADFNTSLADYLHQQSHILGSERFQHKCSLYVTGEKYNSGISSPELGDIFADVGTDSVGNIKLARHVVIAATDPHLQSSNLLSGNDQHA